MNVNGSAMMEADFSQDEEKMEMVNNLKEVPQGDQEKENRNSLVVPPDVEANEGKDFEKNENVNDKKKKRRRRPKGGVKHKKYKPYDKMSWTERRALEEKEAVRANQKREDAFKHGHPVAPYNTTQYLMEDHIKNEEIAPDLHLEGHYHRNNSRESREGSGGGSESSEEFYSSNTDDEEIENDSSYQEHQFTETYDNMAAERLSNMSKDELIKDYVELESKLDRLEKRFQRRQMRSKGGESSGSLSSGGEEYMDIDAVRRFQEENKKLKEENKRLKKEIGIFQDHGIN